MPAVDQAIERIRETLGERISTAAAVRDQHGHDESWHPSKAPDAVCFPETVDEIAGICRICDELKVPIIPFGTGTGVEGHVVAERGGITVDLMKMDKVLRVSAEDMDCTVQAGVTRKQLNEYLRDTGLFFPVDPGADASIGGMASTRASGTNAVRYGTMREQVLSLKVVLADGRVIETGTRARKSAAGYDLTHLFVGSEGTLGIIAEVTLRLHGIPEAVSAARVSFPDVGDAVDAVIETIQTGLPIARIELLDEPAIESINKFSGTDFAVRPTLWVEFHGSPATVEEVAERFRGITADYGGGEFDWTQDAEERARMWQARHDVAYAAKALRPEGFPMSTDVCVPISNLAECIRVAREAAADCKELPSMIVGHVGDGNFHMVFCVDQNSADEIAAMTRANEKIVAAALQLEGTSTGEHGIGIGKLDALLDEAGADAVDVMWAIKHALDPNGIMNPGKKLPELPTAAAAAE